MSSYLCYFYKLVCQGRREAGKAHVLKEDEKDQLRGEVPPKEDIASVSGGLDEEINELLFQRGISLTRGRALS